MDKEELLPWSDYVRSYPCLDHAAVRVDSIARSSKRGIEIEKTLRLAQGARMHLEEKACGLYHL
jgi:hypothetical protein